MKITLNKDLEKAYKAQFFKGFTLRETAYIALALGVIVLVGVIVWNMFHFSINICAYIGMPFAAPVLLIGFKEFQGLTFVEYIKEIYHEHLTSELYYDADEMPENTKVYSMKYETSKKGKRKR